jgi:hypothetical protein
MLSGDGGCPLRCGKNHKQPTSKTWANAQAFTSMNNGYLSQYGVNQVEELSMLVKNIVVTSGQCWRPPPAIPARNRQVPRNAISGRGDGRPVYGNTGVRPSTKSIMTG